MTDALQLQELFSSTVSRPNQNTTERIQTGSDGRNSDLRSCMKIGWRVVWMEKKSGWRKQLWNIYHGILFGMSKVIPLIVTGGLLIAFSNLIGVQLLHYDFSDTASSQGLLWTVLYFMTAAGKLLLAMILPLLSAYTAAGISDSDDSFIPGLAGGLLARGGRLGAVSVIPSGYIGALISGISAGYLAKLLARRMHAVKARSFYDNVLLIPLLTTAVIIVLMCFAVDPAIGSLNQGFLNGLERMQASHMYLLAGAITGAFANFDFGGPVNKIAYMFSTNLWAKGETEFYSAFTAAKIIPSFAIGISALLVPRLYSPSEKKEILPALLMSVFGGIGEGVLPFALKDPFCVIFSMMAGGAVSAAMVLTERIGISVGAGGSLMTVGLTSNPVQWILAFLAGVAVSTALLIALKLRRTAGVRKSNHGAE
jgi:fructose-specific phosphotransferase system IIC component